MEDLEKNGKYLPIGSVVMLQNGKKRIMVTGFCCKEEINPNKIYDYSGCLYPEGIISSEKTLMFNHDQIADIYALGYADQEEYDYKERLVDLLDAAGLNEEDKNE